MRTKTLLISAAALAAGVLASQAQSNVFSANVVGYINSGVVSQQQLLATGLDTGTNDLNNLLGALPNKASVLLWTGTGFTGATKGGSPSVWTPDASVPPGTAYFVKVASGSVTNSVVGQVAVLNQASVTNTLTGGLFYMVGSPIPYADDLNDTSNYLGLLGMPNKSSLLTWTGSNYSGSTKGGSPSVWSPDQTINPGQGFFIKVNATTNWVESLNLQ